MLTLININRMAPLIGPIGLDYVAGAARDAGVNVDVVDLCLTDEPSKRLQDYFATHNPELVGVSLRNVDDSFWPSAQWFVPDLFGATREIRSMTDAPIVLGGVGFSIFAKRIVEHTGADFGIRGDGEQAIISLLAELQGARRFDRVDGLIWRDDGVVRANRPAWPVRHGGLSLPTNRDQIDNLAYFRRGGQCGLETKRGCDRQCLYCADPLAKGTKIRLRNPAEIADEVQALLSQQVEVLHLCDSEFNVPRSHAYAVCEHFNRLSLGKRLRWYAYMAVVPFDAELAKAMSKAGCIGIDFTGDSACPSMLKTYQQRHTKEQIALAVRLCRENNIRVMIDLLLGGPGETPDTLRQTIDSIRQTGPDCVGAALGVRIYPGTAMARLVESEGSLETNPNIRRKYSGPVDFFKPTFYISTSLGQEPARLVKDLIAGDQRFFEPVIEATGESAGSEPSTDHNYNDNAELVQAIEKGARGAYWDILAKLRHS